MNEIIGKNNQAADARIQGEGENQFVVRQIIDDVDKCSANFVEVNPGKYAYGYHYHEENEEVFYIFACGGFDCIHRFFELIPKARFIRIALYPFKKIVQIIFGGFRIIDRRLCNALIFAVLRGFLFAR